MTEISYSFLFGIEEDLIEHLETNNFFDEIEHKDKFLNFIKLKYVKSTPCCGCLRCKSLIVKDAQDIDDAKKILTEDYIKTI